MIPVEIAHIRLAGQWQERALGSAPKKNTDASLLRSLGLRYSYSSYSFSNLRVASVRHFRCLAE